MKKKTIGLLGGIGPESTGFFYLELIRKFIEKNKPKDNSEYPHVIINSISAPELIFNNGTHEILSPYVDGLKQLEKSGSDIIAIICNTAYVYLDTLQRATKVPIINLRAEVEKCLHNLQVKSVTVFGTPYTLASGLYKFSGIKCNELLESEVKDLSRAISNYNLGIDKKKQETFTQNLARKYSKVSESIILGCSEVALMSKELPINKIDPMNVLVDAVLREYAE
ncbi:MAG: amino acid racemase [Minisyncoccia bacterium]|jgi:aspartate racemase